jgi:hypothetical protein
VRGGREKGRSWGGLVAVADAGGEWSFGELGAAAGGVGGRRFIDECRSRDFQLALSMSQIVRLSWLLLPCLGLSITAYLLR